MLLIALATGTADVRAQDAGSAAAAKTMFAHAVAKETAPRARADNVSMREEICIVRSRNKCGDALNATNMITYKSRRLHYTMSIASP